MKKILFIVLVVIVLGIFASESPAKDAVTSGIASVKSNTVVTGLIYGPKIKNSAIVNDTILWEGQAYTINQKTGKISIRTHKERHPNPKKQTSFWVTPKITLLKVSEKGALLSYQETWRDKSVEFLKSLKRQG